MKLDINMVLSQDKDTIYAVTERDDSSRRYVIIKFYYQTAALW